MAQVDTSIYRNVGAGVPTFMENMVNMLRLRTMQTQNQLLQMNAAAKIATGQIAQESVDPQTGQFDLVKFQQGISQSPAAMLNAQDALLKGQQLYTEQLRGKGVDLENQEKKFELQSQLFSPLLEKPDLSTGDFIKMGTDALQNPEYAKVFNQNDLFWFLQQLPPNAKGPQLQQWLKGYLIRTEAGRKAIEATKPHWVPIQSGDRTVMLDDNAGSLSYGSTRVIPMGLPPAQQVETVETGLSSEGQPVKSFKGDIFNQRQGGGGPDEALVQAQTKAPPGTTATQIGGNVFYGEPGKPPEFTTSPNTKTGAGLAGFVTELPKDLAKYKEGAAERLVIYENDLHTAVRAEDEMLQKIAAEREATKNFTSGPGTAVREFIVRMAKASGVDRLNPEAFQRAAQMLLGAKTSADAYTAIQLFKALQVQQATSMLKAGVGAGKITNMEWGKYLDAYPNPNSPPEMIHQFYDVLTRQAQVHRIELKAFNKWKDMARAGKVELTNWPGYWENYVVEHNLIPVPENERRPASPAPESVKAPVSRRPSLDSIFGGK